MELYCQGLSYCFGPAVRAAVAGCRSQNWELINLQIHSGFDFDFQNLNFRYAGANFVANLTVC